MHTKRLLLHELDDQHLTWLQKAVEWSIDTEIAHWLRDVRDGNLALFDLDGRGIIGLRKKEGVVFVELLAGRGLKEIAPEVFAWLRQMGKPIELCTRRKGLMRYFLDLGFEPTVMWMRYDNGRKS